MKANFFTVATALAVFSMAGVGLAAPTPIKVRNEENLKELARGLIERSGADENSMLIIYSSGYERSVTAAGVDAAEILGY